MVVVKVEYSRGFTLIEVLVVLLMTSLLVAAVLPNWRAVQTEALTREAQIALARIDLAQRQFRQQYRRYAQRNELPDLTHFSQTISEYYRLEVEASDTAYFLRLVGLRGDLETLTADHLGVNGSALVTVPK